MKTVRKGERLGRGRFALGFLIVSLLAAVGGVFALAASDGSRGGSRWSGVAGGPGALDRAKIAFVDRDFEEAETLAREAGESGRLLLGRILLERGRLLPAREIFYQILKAEPESPDALRGMGAVLRGLGQHEAAIAYLQKAARIRNSADDWKALGLAQRDRGESLGALTSLQQSLKIDPDQADVSALLTDLVTGKNALAGGPAAGSKTFGIDPMNPRPIDPDALLPRPRPPDPTQFFPKPQGRGR